MNIPGFVEDKVLGKGSYGTVYKAKRVSDQLIYAVKVVNTAGMDRETLEDSVNEIRLMASFKSPFLIGFHEAFCCDQKLCVVTEYARLGDLTHTIERRKRQKRQFLENDIWRYLIQILEGLKVMHESGVIHRDIKSANLLLCGPDLIKIGDLGISTVLRTRKLAKTQIGTPLYLAPEVWKRQPYDEKCDMWSLGVVIYEMMTFAFPFVGKTTEDLGRRIVGGRYAQMYTSYSSDLQNIVKSLLQVNPEARPSAKQLLNSWSVKNRMSLLNVDIEERDEPSRLLSTIKVPRNMRCLALPAPNYCNRNSMVKPLGERLHCKGGAVRAQIENLSTRELQVVSDLDWWSPNKIKSKSSLEDKIEYNQGPLSERGGYNPSILGLRKPMAPIVQPVIDKNPRHKMFVQYQEPRALPPLYAAERPNPRRFF